MKLDRHPSFHLVSDAVRERARAALDAAPKDWVVRMSPPTRSLEQNAFLHAILTDIAQQVEWYGKHLSVIVWKRLCTAAWMREEGEQPELIPALDGNGFDIVFEHTSSLSVEKMTALCEWCLAFGVQRDVTFKEKPIPVPEGR